MPDIVDLPWEPDAAMGKSSVGDHPEQLPAPHDLGTVRDRGRDLLRRAGNRARCHHEHVRLTSQLALVVTDLDPDTELLELLRDRRASTIGTGYAVSPVVQNAGEAAHADATDTDEVEPRRHRW